MPKQTSSDSAEQPIQIRPWLTFPQMCKQLHVSRQYLSGLIADGLIEASRLRDKPGAPYRFHPDEADRYLASCAVKRAS